MLRVKMAYFFLNIFTSYSNKVDPMRLELQRTKNLKFFYTTLHFYGNTPIEDEKETNSSGYFLLLHVSLIKEELYNMYKGRRMFLSVQFVIKFIILFISRKFPQENKLYPLLVLALVYFYKVNFSSFKVSCFMYIFPLHFNLSNYIFRIKLTKIFS